MKVVVTGGSGHTGGPVVEHLLQHGYQVRIADRVRPKNDRAPYMLCDLENAGEAIEALSGAEAVVHLAAIPRPLYHPKSVVFRTNVISTYNVFEAAAILGIERLIYASSISVIGYPFYERFFEPEYVPIDEEHPSAPQDPYGLSKYLGEEIGRSFVRRTDMTVFCLRLPWIHTPETFRSEIAPNRDDPQFGASNLWLYVDARDVGQACRISLESHLKDYQTFYIGAPDSFMETPSIELVKAFYPHTEIRPGFGGRQSLISSLKAEQLLGYKAQYTWESYFRE